MLYFLPETSRQCRLLEILQSHEEIPDLFHGTDRRLGVQSPTRLLGTRHGAEGGQHRSSRQQQRIGRPDHARARDLPGQHHQQVLQRIRASQRPGDRGAPIRSHGRQWHLSLEPQQREQVGGPGPRRIGDREQRPHGGAGA